MLSYCKVSEFSELIANIPAEFLQDVSFKLDEPLSEMEIKKRLDIIVSANISTSNHFSLLGAGIYNHFIPAAISHITGRPEFLTTYTPYQAEVSQGTLQYIFEYQTMICELTGMEVSNAGMYDGASATAEAVLMAARATKRYRALISRTTHPHYMEVIRSYTQGAGIELVEIDEKDGRIDLDHLKSEMSDETACFVMQSPNFLGFIEVEEIVHFVKKTLFIAVVDPISLALLNSPAEYNADIVVGEGQSLGNEQSFGGPLFGFLAAREKLIRSMPGRLVGTTRDTDDKIAYVLTLQAREQHIRREKATSNICSNDALCTLAATVYLSLMGPQGLKEVASQSTTKAHYLAKKLTSLPGFKIYSKAPFFKEFALVTPIPTQKICDYLGSKGLFPGLPIHSFRNKNILLMAVTEKFSKADLDRIVSMIKDMIKNLEEA